MVVAGVDSVAPLAIAVDAVAAGVLLAVVDERNTVERCSRALKILIVTIRLIILQRLLKPVSIGGENVAAAIVIVVPIGCCRC